ncbi:MAG: hypothetical protein QG599_2250 [Pseudomonadota bacterium]|nr:hypothetical protein [Pseudomonadota bacterium]
MRSTTNVYEQGRLLYNDVSDLAFNGNANYNASEDTLIRVGEAAATEITLRSNSVGNAWLSFKPTGRLAETEGAAVYAVCYDGVSTSRIPGRQITVDLTTLASYGGHDGGDVFGGRELAVRTRPTLLSMMYRASGA